MLPVLIEAPIAEALIEPGQDSVKGAEVGGEAAQRSAAVGAECCATREEAFAMGGGVKGTPWFVQMPYNRGWSGLTGHGCLRAWPACVQVITDLPPAIAHVKALPKNGPVFVAAVLCFLLDVVNPNRPLLRFWLLEVCCTNSTCVILDQILCLLMGCTSYRFHHSFQHSG